MMGVHLNYHSYAFGDDHAVIQQSNIVKYAMALSTQYLFCQVYIKLYSMKEIQTSILINKFNLRKN